MLWCCCCRSDLTEATLTGAWLSIAAAVVMFLLLVLVSQGVCWVCRRVLGRPPCTTSCACTVPPQQLTGLAPRLLFRLLQELSAFLSTKTTSELVVDRSPQNELLKITFNMR